MSDSTRTAAPDRVRYRTPSGLRLADAAATRRTSLPGLGREFLRRHRVRVLSALGVLALVLLIGLPGQASSAPAGARTTLVVFVVAVWAWVFTSLDDTYVALGAATLLVLSGVVGADSLFTTLGDDTIWLLVGAFVIAAGVTSSGLAARCAAWLVTGAGNGRQLVHLTTAALVVTAFAVPATSGRAALTLPVFVAIATALQCQASDSRTTGSWADASASTDRLVRALALLFPTVILLSAVASLVGAGAHLVTSRVVQAATGSGFSFATWLILGLPLALVNSHLAAEIVLRLFTRPADRVRPLTISPQELQVHVPTRIQGPLSVRESRAALLLAVVVVLWCTEALHGIDPAIVAVIGALVTTSPRYGSVSLKKSLGKAPWSLLLFMAATLALGDALIVSGAADWLAGIAFGVLPTGSPGLFIAFVVLISVLAHVVIQSRSARSAVLVPLVVALAPAMGVNPAAAAFASTAAAGFCHTLPSSAKPVAMFASVEEVPTYQPADLRRLSLVLGPVTAVLVWIFSVAVWPLLGLPLLLP